jgi:hypothetical protein
MDYLVGERVQGQVAKGTLKGKVRSYDRGIDPVGNLVIQKIHNAEPIE